MDAKIRGGAFLVIVGRKRNRPADIAGLAAQLETGPCAIVQTLDREDHAHRGSGRQFAVMQLDS